MQNDLAAVTFEQFRSVYEQCIDLIPKLSKLVYFEDEESLYSIRDAELFASCYFRSQEAAAALLEHAAFFGTAWAKLQAAILLRENEFPPDVLYKQCGYLRIWRDEIWESASIFCCKNGSGATFWDFREKVYPRQITRITFLTSLNDENALFCKVLDGLKKFASEEELLNYAIMSYNQLQGGALKRLKECKQKKLILMSERNIETYTSANTIFGIEFCECQVSGYETERIDKDEICDATLTIFFDFDPQYCDVK